MVCLSGGTVLWLPQWLCRDEVQDFTQAELLIDLKIVADPNGLFL